MPRNRISDADRQRPIDAHATHEEYAEVAWLLGVVRRMMYVIVQRYQQPRSRGGAHNKRMDEEMADTVVLIVEKNREYTIRRINMELQKLIV